jgi:hypothetical protein
VKKFVSFIDPSLPTPIKFVRQYKTRKVVYDVEMETPFASQAIRDAFGLFWRQKSGRRLPDGLKGVSFANASTFSTRVRVRLLKEISRRHQAANPSVSCYVTNYLSRPELKVRERRGPLNSYTYSEAIQKFPHHLTLEFLRDLYLFAKTNLPEREVIDRFLILTPDLFDVPQAQPEPEGMAVDENPIQAPPASSPSTLTVAPPSTLSTQAAGSGQPTPGTSSTNFSPPPSTFQVGANSTVVSTPLHSQGSVTAGTPFEIANLGASDGFVVVQKKNRNRFTKSKRSQPYPPQNQPS